MTLSSMLALVLLEIIEQTSPSITGVTYRDNFDFEKRYRDANHCNPLYWHPLHLPPECAYMYGNIIRTKLKDFVSDVSNGCGSIDQGGKKEHRQDIYGELGDYHDASVGSAYIELGYLQSEMHPQLAPTVMYNQKIGHINPYSDFNQIAEYVPSPLEIYNREIDHINPYTNTGKVVEYEPTFSDRRRMTPIEKMLKQIAADIKKEPSYPEPALHPQLGPVVMYNQEISKKSKSMIKELATAYGKLGQDFYADAFGLEKSVDPQVYFWDSQKNLTKQSTEKNIKKENKKKKKKNVTKTKIGNIVTIVEGFNPELTKVK